MAAQAFRRMTDRRREARCSKPLWLFVDGEPYMVENWSMNGLFIRGTIPDIAVGDLLSVRIAINPISEQPAASCFVSVVRLDEGGTAFRIRRMNAYLFDVMTAVMRTTGLVLD